MVRPKKKKKVRSGMVRPKEKCGPVWSAPQKSVVRHFFLVWCGMVRTPKSVVRCGAPKKKVWSGVVRPPQVWSATYGGPH